MKIVLVDDDAFVLMALKTILEADGKIDVIATGSSGADAIELYNQYLPDVLVMDIRMDDVNGLTAGRQIIEKYPEAKILLLTTFLDDEYIIRAIRFGAKGYILKQSFETIAPAISAVNNGQTVFGEEIMTKMPDLLSGKKRFDKDSFGLTDKELEIITLVAEGLNNKEISGELYLGEGTVRNYISTILEKLELRDRTQLACFYYKNCQ
ncbi:MAG: response regulator transcription factor [Clostridiales bacterium]|nr:response regulator transcription factor [Clostridiales bacterium]